MATDDVDEGARRCDVGAVGRKSAHTSLKLTFSHMCRSLWYNLVYTFSTPPVLEPQLRRDILPHQKKKKKDKMAVIKKSQESIGSKLKVSSVFGSDRIVIG